MKSPLLLIIGILTFTLFLIACSPSQTINSEKSCIQDSDCVPAACCHANDSLNSKYAPNCKSTLCSMDCEPKTLDCSQGKVQCINKQCSAIIP